MVHGVDGAGVKIAEKRASTMGLKRVQEIEQAIGTLTPQELEELYARLDRAESPLDARISSDLASGGLDHAIRRALADERDGRLQPL
jgi:hypothetical protein